MTSENGKWGIKTIKVCAKSDCWEFKSLHLVPKVLTNYCPLVNILKYFAKKVFSRYFPLAHINKGVRSLTVRSKMNKYEHVWGWGSLYGGCWDRGWWGPYTGLGPGRGGGVGSLYGEVQCIMGNGHMGLPCRKNDRHTRLKTLIAVWIRQNFWYETGRVFNGNLNSSKQVMEKRAHPDTKKITRY